VSLLNVFFFQAEDGIRDGHVTGVQTCALPIWPRGFVHRSPPRRMAVAGRSLGAVPEHARAPGGVPAGTRVPRRRTPPGAAVRPRSEERRVGKECRTRWLS